MAEFLVIGLQRQKLKCGVGLSIAPSKLESIANL